MNHRVLPVIYLVRHCRTALNVAGVLRGRLDPELDEVGHQEAAALGNYFSNRGLVTVVSGPLRRTMETATAVAVRAGLLVEIDGRLNDRDYGQWAGLRSSEVVERWGSIDAAPGVESIDEVLSRCMSALRDAASRVGDGPLLLVSHDAVNRLALGALDRSLGDPSTIPQATGCFNVITVRDEVLIVDSINNMVPLAVHDQVRTTRSKGGVGG